MSERPSKKEETVKPKRGAEDKPLLQLETQEVERAKLEQTQQDLLLMEQSAAFYALHYGKDNPIAQDFEASRQELENKMREELFTDWAARTGYVGNPKKAEYPEADARATEAVAERAQGKPAETVSYAPFTEEDLQIVLEKPTEPQSPDQNEAASRLEEAFQPLVMQNNERGDNIVIVSTGEAVGRRKKEKPLPDEIIKVVRRTHEEEEEEEQKKKRKKKKKKEEKTEEEPEKTPEVPKTLEQSRSRRGWGWLKERAKGLVTVGFWEVHQAERFRSATKGVAKDVGARAEEIQKTANLSLEDALAEADKIQFAIESAGSKSKQGKSTAENIERLSEAITKEKVEQNNRVIDETVRQAESELRKRLERYRNEYGERVVVDNEAIAKTMNNLRTELQILQDGRRETDVREIRTALRSLDLKYWRRYIYGGVEAALVIGGGYLAWTKLLADKACLVGAKIAESTPMHNTIWQTSEELLKTHGITNPTKGEIQTLSGAFSKLNSIGVKVWSILGSPMDTAMQQGHVLKIPQATLKVLLHARGIPA